MALSALEQNTISRGAAAAKKLLEMYGELTQLNALYDSEGGVKKTVDQKGLDTISSFSGMSKAKLDDGMYVVTTTVREALANSIAALTELAARS